MPSSMLLRTSRAAARAACSAVSAASRRASVTGSAGGAAAAAQYPLLRRSPHVVSPPLGRWLSSSSHTARFKPGRRVEFVVEDKDRESDEALWALYERWCEAFGAERSREEMQRRFGRFKEFVDRFNMEGIRDGKGVRVEVNMFADGKLMEQLCNKVPVEAIDRVINKIGKFNRKTPR